MRGTRRRMGWIAWMQRAPEEPWGQPTVETARGGAGFRRTRVAVGNLRRHRREGKENHEEFPEATDVLNQDVAEDAAERVLFKGRNVVGLAQSLAGREQVSRHAHRRACARETHHEGRADGACEDDGHYR